MKITQANYVKARDALIPDALKEARRITGKRDGTDFDREFMKAVDRLCIENGVVTVGGPK